MFAPIAFALLLRAAAGGRDRSLARGLRRRRSASGCARSASSRRWRRWRPTPTSARPIRFPSSSTSGPLFDADGARPSADRRRGRRPQRRAPRRRRAARDRRQRLEHVGQEHAAAVGRRQRRAGAGRRAGARARRCGCRRSRSARRCASRTRCRPATRASTPRSCASATIVDAARGPLPLLFLLDEILHGTNSHDRRIGAEAIVRGAGRRSARSAW